LPGRVPGSGGCQNDPRGRDGKGKELARRKMQSADEQVRIALAPLEFGRHPVKVEVCGRMISRSSAGKSRSSSVRQPGLE